MTHRVICLRIYLIRVIKSMHACTPENKSYLFFSLLIAFFFSVPIPLDLCGGDRIRYAESHKYVEFKSTEKL